MAVINAFLYANRMIKHDTEGGELPSIMWYKSGGNVRASFPYKRLIVGVQGGDVWEGEFVTLENGIRLTLKIEHKVQADGERYKHWYVITLRGYYQGTEINDTSNLKLPDTKTSAPEYTPYIDSPYLNTLYVYHGMTQYNVDGGDNIVNDPCQTVYPWYFIWHKWDNLGPDDLIGDFPLSQFQRHWIDISGPNLANDTEYNNWHNRLVAVGNGSDPVESGTPEPNPQPNPDDSQPGGGDSPINDFGDPINFPGLPTVDVIQTGLVSVYNPTATQLRSLASALWSNDFENSIKKILNDPFDAIIGLSLVPFSPATSGSANCDIGNFDTQVTMPVVSNQYYTIDCGTLNISENWHNALDYSPSTSIEVFIPFVGFKHLKTEDVMNSTLALKYNIDLLSGSGVAMLKCGNKVLYTYPCRVTYDVPLTGSNKAALYTGMISIATSAIGGAAAGGAMGAIGGAANSAIQTATSKQSDIERSGSITSNTGMLGDFVPYVVIHRPDQSLPADFKKIKGYQSNITKKLSTLTGYTEVDFIHLDGIDGATDTELKEIERLLKDGVLI